jgi:putative transposase
MVQWGQSLQIAGPRRLAGSVLANCNKPASAGVLWDMARPIRMEFAGAIYHVLSRGNEKRTTFLDDRDFLTFQRLMAEAAHRFRLDILSYCLMSNHIHLLIRTPQMGLSRAMKWLLGVYTMKFNRRHERVGHLFQGRFKGLLVDKDSYLLEVSRYIHLNPCRAGIESDPEAYRWSSMRSIMQGFLQPQPVLSQFSSLKAYRAFVLEGLGTNRNVEMEIKCGAFLGPDDFVERMKAEIRTPRRSDISFKRGLFGIPAHQLEFVNELPQEVAVLVHWLLGKETQIEIGRRFGLSPWKTCRLIEKGRKALEVDPSFKEKLTDLADKLQFARTDPIGGGGFAICKD